MDTIHFTQRQSALHSIGKRPKHLHVSVSSAGAVTVREDTQHVDNQSSKQISIFRRAANVLRALFLPVGYPHSVTPDYLAFQTWDTAQAMCSYLRGILATQAILDGVGVGDGTKTVASATLQWVTRDGASMLGGLIFTWWGGSNFDRSVKFWRLFADAINDVGLTLEMISPLCGEYFLLVACVGNICKTMCGISAGATRTAITAHFAIRGNLADVAAKEGSQETAVNMLGLVSGVTFAYYANSSPTTIWITFAILTIIHVVANYFAVQSLQMTRINAARLHVIVDDIIRFCDKDEAGNASSEAASIPDWYGDPCFSRKEVNARESLIYPWGGDDARHPADKQQARVRFEVGRGLDTVPPDAIGWKSLTSMFRGPGRLPYCALVSGTKNWTHVVVHVVFSKYVFLSLPVRYGVNAVAHLLATRRHLTPKQQLDAHITAELLQREIGTASKAVGRDTLPTLVAQLLLEVNRVPAADEVGDDEDFVAPIRPQQRRRWMHWHRRQHVTNVLKKHNWQTEYFDFPHVYAELSSESEPGLDGDKLS